MEVLEGISSLDSHLINQERTDTLIIIPVYNPPERFYKLLQRIAEYGVDILIIDDNSDSIDKNRISPLHSIIRHSENLGKGRCLKDGFSYSLKNRYEWVITIDADYQHLPEDIPKFTELIKENTYDIIIGNRMKNKERFPKKRYYANKISSKVLSILVGKRFYDSQCGFRAYRTEILTRLPLRYDDFSLETEILVYAAKLKLRVKETDIEAVYYENKENVSHFRPVRDLIVISFKSLFIIIEQLFK